MPTFAYSGRTRGGENVTGERIADNADAAVAALRREQVLVTRIAPTKEKAAAARRAEEGQARQEGQSEEPRGVRPAVLGHDRRRPAARAVPRDSGHPGRRQELRRDDPGDALGRRKRRVARRRDEEASEGVRSAVHQHDCRRRGRRYSRHDSQAARDLHRKGRQAEGPGQVGDDLSRSPSSSSPWSSSASFCGRSFRRSRRCSPASAPSCRCRRASSSRSATSSSTSCRSSSSASARSATRFKSYYGDGGRQVPDRRHHAEAAGARAADAQDRRRAVLPHAVDAAELGRARFSTASTSRRARRATSVIEEAILQTRKSIERGETISAPLKETGVFPPMVTQMIAVGETTGALDTMLVEDRGLLRRRSRHGGRRPADAARADHDRVSRRRRRRHRHRDVSADLRLDPQLA